MSDKYTIKHKEGAYFLTLTVVAWIDLFTHPVEARIVNEPSHYLYSSALAYERRPGLVDVEFLY